MIQYFKTQSIVDDSPTSLKSNADIDDEIAVLAKCWAVPENVGDALLLLGPNFVHAKVRSCAVERIATCDDGELLHLLPSLVQALKLEPHLDRFDIFDFVFVLVF